MARLLAVAAGRRSKWIVVAVWLVFVLVAGGANLPGKFSDAEKNDSASFLPGYAESTKALDATKKLQGGEQAPMVAIFRRVGGLTAADKQTIRERITRFNSERARLAAAGEDPFKRTQPFKQQAAVTGRRDPFGQHQRRHRQVGDDPGPGRQGARRSSATRAAACRRRSPAAPGFSADAIKVFESINGTLLLAAGGLVFVLLILIYRSPFFFLIPLSAVAFAELASRAIGYGLTEAGVTVNGQSSSILSVLVLGAGHGLRAAARRPLPRGAAPPRGQARGAAARAARGRARRSSPAP